MAVRIISASGGNFNSTGTWVGGVVPTTSDSIVGNSSSGNLTINVSSTVTGFRFDGGDGTSFYAGTLTLSANFILGPIGDIYFSPNMGITGSAEMTLYSGGNYKTYGKYIPCSVGLSNNTKTFLDDFNWQPANGTIRSLGIGVYTTGAGTYSLVAWGGINQAQFPSTITQVSSSATFKQHNGTMNFGTIRLSNNVRVKFDTGSGTSSIGLIEGGGTNGNSVMEYISGGWTGSLWVHNPNSLGCDISFINVPLIKKFVVYQLNTAAQVYRSNVPLNVTRIGINGPDSATFSGLGTIFHGGLSCSTFYAAVGRNYSVDHIAPAVSVLFASGATYTINELIIDGGGSTVNSKLRSVTASQPATINLTGGTTDNIIVSTDITDINFTGTTPVYAIAGSTLTRTTGVTTSFSTGGGGTSSVGGGPSSMTFLM